MDDDILGPQRTPAGEKFHKELQRKSNDRIRVYNPTDDDFIIRFDGIPWRIPSKNKDIGVGPGQVILPRYVARNYATHMTDKILGERMTKAVYDENNRRIEAGMAPMTKYQEQENFERSFKIDNPESRKIVLSIIWLGIEEEYGMDFIEQEINRDTPADIVRDEELLESLDKPAQRIDRQVDLSTILPQHVAGGVGPAEAKQPAKTSVPYTPSPVAPIDLKPAPTPPSPIAERKPEPPVRVNDLPLDTPPQGSALVGERDNVDEEADDSGLPDLPPVNDPNIIAKRQDELLNGQMQ